jgi:predicted transcriptional regulator
MPLKHGRTARTIRTNLSRNIATERRAGRPIKQSQAIAYSVARRDAQKAGIRLRGARMSKRKR